MPFQSPERPEVMRFGGQKIKLPVQQFTPVAKQVDVRPVGGVVGARRKFVQETIDDSDTSVEVAPGEALFYFR